MKTKIHAAAGGIAFLTILLFWISSVVSELAGSTSDIIQVKTTILYGMGVLIPMLMMTGASGFSLGRHWKSDLVAAKARRMKLIAVNGLMVLLPSAILLAYLARSEMFGNLFYVVQGLELIFGAVNMTLIGLNMKAGQAITARRRRRA